MHKIKTATAFFARPGGRAALQLAFYWRFPQWSNCDPADLVLTHSIGFCSVPFRWTEPLYRQ
ncbi:hypothetical protein NKJ46_01520 [Mesorhizobium sp. M0166]|uniref:hypothetical protein n=1 Tax=unclassified Mesorhizobium TaxID=325217 RepID=UPI0033358E34